MIFQNNVSIPENATEQYIKDAFREDLQIGPAVQPYEMPEQGYKVIGLYAPEVTQEGQ